MKERVNHHTFRQTLDRSGGALLTLVFNKARRWSRIAKMTSGIHRTRAYAAKNNALGFVLVHDPNGFWLTDMGMDIVGLAYRDVGALHVVVAQLDNAARQIVLDMIVRRFSRAS